jgi:hypothetical protein
VPHSRHRDHNPDALAPTGIHETQGGRSILTAQKHPAGTADGLAPLLRQFRRPLLDGSAIRALDEAFFVTSLVT